MRSNYAKKLVAGTLVASMTITASMPLFADELATEIPSAGAAVIVEDYINNSGKETDIEKLLPTEATDSTATSNETTKTENQTEKTQTSNTATSSEDKLFANIAITKVSGGAEDYVNVRKKPTTESKVVGKIYNNSGAKILEKTNNGWYKIVSGNCTGYIKSDFFVTGSSAKSRALDNGYVQAEAKDAIHVRAEASTNSKVVTNVYKNETYTIKKFDKTGEWIKVKIKAGVSGWISAQYANVNINMETAITRKEEKAKIKKEREAAKAAAEEEARKQAEQQEQQRRHAVADGAQQRSLHIIKHRQRDAQQNDGQVGGRAAPCLCRDLQNGQQRGAAQQGAPRQHQRHRRRQRDHPAHGAAYPAFIARAKIAADRQRQAVVHAEGKVHDKPVQRRRRADLRQRGGTQQVPGQRSVGQVVQLLQKVGAEQRHRKLQHQAERVALCHIQHTAFVRGGHSVTSPLLVAGSIIRDGTGRVNRIIPARDPGKTAGNVERNVWNFPKQSNSFADGKPGPGVV